MRTRALLVFLLAPLFGASQHHSPMIDKGIQLLDKDHQKAIQIFSAAIKESEDANDDSELTECLNSIVSLKLPFEDEDRLDLFNKMKRLAKRTWSTNSLSCSRLLVSTGEMSSRYNFKLDSTIMLYRRSLEIAEMNGAGRSELSSRCFEGLGDVYKYWLNSSADAEKSYEIALNIIEEVGETDKFRVARLYYNLAATNRSQQDYENALSYGIACIQLSRDLDTPLMLEQIYTIVANVYRDMRLSPQARKYYTLAIELNRKSSNSSATLAWHYNGLGEMLTNDSAYSEALQIFNKADKLYAELFIRNELSESYLINWIYSLLKKAQVLQSLNRYDESRITLQSTLQKIEAMNGNLEQLTSEAFFAFGNYYFEIQQDSSAMTHYQKALGVLDIRVNPNDFFSDPILSQETNYITYEILIRKASIFKNWYDKAKTPGFLNKSYRCLQLAEEIFSEMANEVDVEESRWHYIESNFDLYEQLISRLYEQYDEAPSDALANQIFFYFEKSKTRSLREGLDQAERNMVISRQDTLLHAISRAKSSRFSLQRRLTSEERNQRPDSSTIYLLRQLLVNVDRDIKRIEIEIRIKYPGYFKLKDVSSIPNLADVQKVLFNKENKVLIEYFYGNENVYAISISRNSYLIKKIGLVADLNPSLTGLLNHFRDNHSSLDLDAYSTFVNNSNELYNQLILPFDSEGKVGDKLIIIPDGLLSFVPFESLITTRPLSVEKVNYRQLNFVIKHSTIGYGYSASVLARTHDSGNHMQVMFAMGFTNSSLLTSTGIKFSEIGGVSEELNGLENIFHSGKFLKGLDVTESNFKHYAPTADIVHLAVHGIGDDKMGYNSSLFFETEGDSTEDGQLYAFELYGLRLKARLAVLTSCESSIGKMYKGEGMMGMANAFTYAGCENTVTSLWKLNDQASVGLIDDFYSMLKSGHSISDALTIAKRDFINEADEYTADPRSWASMVAYGNLNPLFNKMQIPIYLMIILIAGAFLAGFLLLVVKRK